MEKEILKHFRQQVNKNHITELEFYSSLNMTREGEKKLKGILSEEETTG